jgi:mono/diheme cytochrome c family protein
MARYRLRPRSGVAVNVPLLAGALLLVAGAGRAQAQAPAAPTPQAAADTAAATDEVVDAGRKIFHGKGTCHACHGDQLQGGPVAPSLRGPKWRHIDGSFEAILQRVRGGYPGTVMVSRPGGIDDAQTIQVATYVWAVSQGKTKP